LAHAPCGCRGERASSVSCLDIVRAITHIETAGRFRADEVCSVQNGVGVRLVQRRVVSSHHDLKEAGQTEQIQAAERHRRALGGHHTERGTGEVQLGERLARARVEAGHVVVGSLVELLVGSQQPLGGGLVAYQHAHLLRERDPDVPHQLVVGERCAEHGLGGVAERRPDVRNRVQQRSVEIEQHGIERAQALADGSRGIHSRHSSTPRAEPDSASAWASSSVRTPRNSRYAAIAPAPYRAAVKK